MHIGCLNGDGQCQHSDIKELLANLNLGYENLPPRDENDGLCTESLRLYSELKLNPQLFSEIFYRITKAKVNKELVCKLDW